MTELAITGLDEEAWGVWTQYKQSRGESYKTKASERREAVRLAGFGEEQMAMVVNAIDRKWSGLYPVRKEQDKNERTPKEKTRDLAQFARANKESERGWGIECKGPLGKLHLAEALLARYDVLDDGGGNYAERREWLKDRVAGLLREADPGACLQDLTVMRLVIRLWPNGLRRLESRAEERKAA